MGADEFRPNGHAHAMHALASWRRMHGLSIRGENRGELVDGFGDVVRSLEQIAGVNGVVTTLGWLLGEQAESPIAQVYAFDESS